jgi:hypothetical protein
MLFSSSSDLLRSAVSHLYGYRDALRVVARQSGTFTPPVTLRNVVFLAMQALNVTFPGGTNSIDHASNTTGVSPYFDRTTSSSVPGRQC